MIIPVPVDPKTVEFLKSEGFESLVTIRATIQVTVRTKKAGWEESTVKWASAGVDEKLDPEAFGPIWEPLLACLKAEGRGIVEASLKAIKEKL